MRRAMNRVLQDAYFDDCNRAVRKWNKTIEKAGFDFRLSMPSRRFNRHLGPFAGMPYNPKGELCEHMTREELVAAYTPSREDIEYEKEIMKPVRERGKFANWIAPPKSGANRQTLDYEYVRFV